MIRCDAIKPSHSPHAIQCKRMATWVCSWSNGNGHLWYRGPHKAHRVKDVSLSDWKRIK